MLILSHGCEHFLSPVHKSRFARDKMHPGTDKSYEAADNLRQQLTNYLRESSAVRSQSDELRRSGQLGFRDYDENDEEF